mmetsp:Transcript_11128/g.35308  ORF Transcript_11128/g.35308 Transcript_11128/m.35308 type:complete len:200 (+) Transcript_11128:31-630(+)
MEYAASARLPCSYGSDESDAQGLEVAEPADRGLPPSGRDPTACPPACACPGAGAPLWGCVHACSDIEKGSANGGSCEGSAPPAGSWVLPRVWQSTETMAAVFRPIPRLSEFYGLKGMMPTVSWLIFRRDWLYGKMAIMATVFWLLFYVNRFGGMIVMMAQVFEMMDKVVVLISRRNRLYGGKFERMAMGSKTIFRLSRL